MSQYLEQAKALMREEIPALAFLSEFTDAQAVDIALLAYVDSVKQKRKRDRNRQRRATSALPAARSASRRCQGQ